LFGLVSGLALGVMSHGTAQLPSLANGNMVIAGDEAQPNTEEGTHTGPNQGATPENGGSAGQPQSHHRRRC